MINKINPKEFMRHKMVVLMESKPLTDDFEQVMLTEEQLAELHAMIEDFMPRCDKDANRYHMALNEDFSVKIPDIPDAYEKERIEQCAAKGATNCPP